jgi:hypothetical protein
MNALNSDNQLIKEINMLKNEKNNNKPLKKNNKKNIPPDLSIENTNEERKISFNGMNNKYQMKKLISEKEENKKRVVAQKCDFSLDNISFEKQLQLLVSIREQIDAPLKDKMNNETKWILKEIERKMCGYKHQDLEKDVFEVEQFIPLLEIINKMIDTELKCYYCKQEMLVLYEYIREARQWTIDRDNNDLGHNVNNYVLACLECNLKRKRRQKDAFLFTKQLNIIRET